MKFFLNTFFMIILLVSTAFSQLTPQDAIGQMLKGINIGNTMELDPNVSWNKGPVKEYFFDDYKNAGFTCVRFPIKWDEHTTKTAPYKIDGAWLNTVEQVIDWGLKRDLFLIINGHHEDWLKNNYSATNKARYDSIWSQISVRFKDKSDKLFFEMINEPFNMTTTQVNDLNARILSIIRKTNPTRIVVYSGKEYCGANLLFEAAIPKDDYIMGYFHSYDPWSFAGEGNGTWGTTSDRSSAASRFKSVADWSAKNNIPVMLSEFGAVKKCDYNSRMYYYSVYVEEAIKNGVAYQVWDDGGDFGIYERTTRTWPDVVDILTKTDPMGPTLLKTKSMGDTLRLSWTNRTIDTGDIIIQRKTTSDFVNVATLPAGSTTFYDAGRTTGSTYYYRIIVTRDNAADMYSYPIKALLEPTERSNFGGEPFPIPGTIEAEDYDIGGEGLTYHDTEPDNIPGDYRPTEGVDVEKRDDGGYHVGYIESGEWLEYTINVAKAGDYTVTTHIASMEGGSRFLFECAGKRSSVVRAPQTNSWQTTMPVTATISLPAGEQILRVRITSSNSFNIDKYVFEKSEASDVLNQQDSQTPFKFSIYPNPVSQQLSVSYDNFAGHEKIEIYNILGQLVKSIHMTSPTFQFHLNDLPRGAYFLRVRSPQAICIQHKFFIQ